MGALVNISQLTCVDPDGCAVRARELAAQQTAQMTKASWLLRTMREIDPKALHLEISEHSALRLVRRAISADLIRLAARAKGEPFALRHEPGSYKVYLLAQVQGRPVHIVIAVGHYAWRLVTVTRPDTRPWQWDPEYRHKCCWCSHGELDD